MQNSHIKIILSILILAFAIDLRAAAGVLDLTRIGMGAKSLGLGRAQVAAGDIGSAFVNPAAFGNFESFSLTSMYTNLSEDVAHNMIGIAIPLREGAYGSLGIGYVGAGIAGISITSAETRTSPTGTTDYSNRLLLVCYGRDLTPFLQGGITAKFLTRAFESVHNGSASGTDLDLGILFYPKDNFTAGFTIQNILNTQLSWKSGTIEDITSNMKFGLNFKPSKVLAFLADFESNQQIHAGLEWHPKEFLSIRGGMESLPISNKEKVVNYSLGVGLVFRGVSFDYAYYLDSVLSQNSSHFLSLSFIVPQKMEEIRPVMPAGLDPAKVALN